MLRPICAIVGLLLWAASSEAELVRLSVESDTPYAKDPEHYELLEGHFEGALRPRDAHNAIINDIERAPRDAEGLVHYRATFSILKPRDAARTSGVLVYDVPNRGHGQVAAFPEGHISVISGWQGDLSTLPDLQTIQVPVAANPDGSSILGRVIATFTDMAPGAAVLDIMGGIPGGIGSRNFAPATERGARLTTIERDDAPPVEIPRHHWSFADCSAKDFPGKPDLDKLCVKGGFNPKYAYTLSFLTKDPKVLGVGLAATRDLVSFLRYADKDSFGAPNPLANVIHWAIGRGISQSGNYLRSFVHLGFNASEDGRIVFDGLQPMIAVRQVAMNFRFANPGGAANLYEPGSDGVVWWTSYRDRVRGLATASLLDRCSASHTCPKITEELGSSEFWGLRASPDFVGTDAQTDLPLPGNVRRYYNPAVTHGGGPRAGFELTGIAPRGCTLPANPNPAFYTDRAIFSALVNWVTKNIEPPASRFPTLAAGDLVAPKADALYYPIIPDKPLPDGHLNPLLQYDFGRNFHAADLTGVIDMQPPNIIKTLPSLVPRVDGDGNELSGVRSVLLRAPLGTYLGWNVTATGFHAGQGCGFQGGFIPFALTRQERLASGDPRASVQERYRDHAGYVEQVKLAARQVVEERFLMPADAEEIIRAAEESNVLVHSD
jgi:hypothetical protein